MKYLISIKLVFLFLVLNGQNKDFSKAILTDEVSIKDKIFRSLHEKCMAEMYEVSKGNLLFYDWNSKNHIVKFSEKNKYPEKPSEVIIFLKPEGKFDANPPLEIKTDTTGKTTSAQFILESEISYSCKHIDAVTSRILQNKTIVIQKLEKKTLKVDKPEKEFGGDPATIRKSNPRKYEELLTELRKKYEKNIEDEYINSFFTQMAISRIAQFVLSGSQHYFNVIPPAGTPEKKIKHITLEGGIKDNLVKKDNYNVLTKRTIGNYHYYEDIASVYIDEVGEKESKASTLLFASKDIGSAFANKEQLLLVKDDNTFLINQLNIKPNEQKVNIAIKKNCMFCEEYLEGRLYDCPVFSLIERNAPELKYFNELSKDERFIDYSTSDLQGKQLGYDLLLTQNDKYYQVVETATNKSIASFETKAKLIPTTSSNDVLAPHKVVSDISQADIQRFLAAYKPDVYKIEWVCTLEEKKEKIEKIAVYHAAGMDRYMEYNFYTVVAETVDGEKIERKNKIGRGRIGKSLSPNISELNVKDGEKDIFKAVKNGETIHIEVSDNTRI